MNAAQPDSIERYHRRRQRAKALDPKPQRCTNPHCPTGWERLADGPYCLHCHVQVQDRADLLRATKEG